MTISEVSQKYGLSADTLRYYEKEGLIPPVRRTESGLRDYSEKDIRAVEFIKCMRRAGLPVETLRKYVAMVQQGKRTLSARKKLLMDEREKLQAQIAQMQESLQRLNYKIEVYEEALTSKDHVLKF